MKFLFSCLFVFLVSCTSSPSKIAGNEEPIFHLAIDENQPAFSQVQIEIQVPARVSEFKVSQDFGGGGLFKAWSDFTATTDKGTRLAVKVIPERKTVTVKTNGSSYTLKYRYQIPQKIAGEVDISAPTLDEKHGRFDNNLTFLVPQGIKDCPARLVVSAPPDWPVVTSWGKGRDIKVNSVHWLSMGMIAMGDYRLSEQQVGQSKVTFAIRGPFDDQILKDSFAKVFKTQEDVVGPFSYRNFLVVFQPRVGEGAQGSSLTNSLIVNLPPKEKLKPFNFAVVGTISHELFHQRNIYAITPLHEEGIYLFTEGFDNYFAVATLVRAGFVTPERFARFLWRYRQMLEQNPNYPAADFAAMQKGFAADDAKLIDLAYSKGPFVAVLLDPALREETQGKQSLTSWFRLLTERFTGKPGYTVEDLRSSLVEVSGGSARIGALFDSAFLGREKLDLDSLFKRLGIQCSKAGECKLKKLPARGQEFRQKCFAAQI